MILGDCVDVEDDGFSEDIEACDGVLRVRGEVHDSAGAVVDAFGDEIDGFCVGGDDGEFGVGPIERDDFARNAGVGWGNAQRLDLLDAALAASQCHGIGAGGETEADIAHRVGVVSFALNDGVAIGGEDRLDDFDGRRCADFGFGCRGNRGGVFRRLGMPPCGSLRVRFG